MALSCISRTRLIWKRGKAIIRRKYWISLSNGPLLQSKESDAVFGLGLILSCPEDFAANPYHVAAMLYGDCVVVAHAP